MIKDRILFISEIEIGPHFLTVYGFPNSNILKLGETMYHYIKRYKKDIFNLQQDRLSHIINDPNVFHPYGQPDEIGKKDIRHFHIKYGYRPIQEDVNEIIGICEKYANLRDDIVITDLLDFDKNNIGYPEIPMDMDYLDWVNYLREGTWIYDKSSNNS